MTEGQRNYIKSALLKCAKENENRDYATGHVVVKTVCESAAERIEELEKQVEQMKNCTDNRNVGYDNVGYGNAGNRNVGDVNEGSWNVGNRNEGYWNADNNVGNCNVGNRNVGNRNVSNDNKGDWNVGNRNVGNRNAGNRNKGDWNVGNRNVGNWNVGNRNVGDWNVGSWNVGYSNVGNWNVGNRNVGDWNVGSWNVGSWNVGYSNVGYSNVGNGNTGSWNVSNGNTGFFNTDTPTVRMFNKDTGLKRSDIDFPSFLYFNLTKWVSCDDASDEEKQEHKQELDVMGGFLKKLDYKEAFRLSWNNASTEEHKELLSLPNWDNEIFKEIFGIDAEAEIAKEENENAFVEGNETLL